MAALVLVGASRVRIVLVRPHYPENLGAVARSMKTMGLSDLALVRPGRLAVPEHEMARKMAVKSWDVLDGATRARTLAEALDGVELVVATSARRGVSGVIAPREAARLVVARTLAGERAAVVFGNEKSGLTKLELESAQLRVRIPMVADQPSINLAQAVQIVAYELLLAGLAARAASG